MPMSPIDIEHYQGKCDPDTCELCAIERLHPRAKPLVNTGMMVHIGGEARPVWSFDGKRLFAGKGMDPDNPTGGEHRVFSHMDLEKLQATIIIAEAIAAAARETQ